MNYNNNVLAHKKLGSQLFPPTRTTNLREVHLNESAGPTLKLVFSYIIWAVKNTRHSIFKSTRIISANEPDEPINQKEFINLMRYNRQCELFNTIISINKFTLTSYITIIEMN
jgi:hypothetical protein